ncbi:MAG: NADPH-Fe(3+) oxidoreductase subunit beta [Haliscomenobacter sp.]|nr:NADPH-Fe(3+) oxidoreductase subunit beta [Haliscomenobacter sp.]
MQSSEFDLTKPVDLSDHAEGTGALRSRIPVYKDFLPPCNRSCPSGENVQAWMAFAQSGNYEAAFQQVMEDNPFPSISGRVCVHPCETGCNRTHIDTTVNIHAVERFIGDLSLEAKWPVRYQAKPSGKKVLVVGAGPAGLSAAYHLTRMGHKVEIFEGRSAPGGLLHYGIPSYRLPAEIRDGEINRVLSMGVRLHLNHKVDDVLLEKEKGRFDAVFVAVGAQISKKEPITYTNAVPVWDAFQVLYGVSQNQPPQLGSRVIIYGGGKLAMYLSRVMRRLGITAQVLYSGDQKLMPAYDFEADDAIAEGIEIKLLRAIREVEENRFKVEIMQLEKGKIVGSGTYETLEADSLILATGQEGDTSFLQGIDGLQLKDDGTVAVDEGRATGHPGIFAGGDVAGGERSVIIALGQGKKAAKYINAYLKGEAFQKPVKNATAFFRKMHMWFKTEAPLQEQSKLAPSIAVRSFEEVVAGFNEKEARYEAQRCLSCGNCFECDGCFGACPEDAIIKLGPGKGYKFDYDACTGCGVCFEQCPCYAIDMIPEPDKDSNHA